MFWRWIYLITSPLSLCFKVHWTVPIIRCTWCASSIESHVIMCSFWYMGLSAFTVMFPPFLLLALVDVLFNEDPEYSVHLGVCCVIWYIVWWRFWLFTIFGKILHILIHCLVKILSTRTIREYVTQTNTLIDDCPKDSVYSGGLYTYYYIIRQLSRIFGIFGKSLGELAYFAVLILIIWDSPRGCLLKSLLWVPCPGIVYLEFYQSLWFSCNSLWPFCVSCVVFMGHIVCCIL